MRCLIARIKHGAALAPAACLAVPEEADVEEEELSENTVEARRKADFMGANRANDAFRDEVEADVLPSFKQNKHLLQWPAIPAEIEEI